MDLEIPEDPCQWVPFITPAYKSRTANYGEIENQTENNFASDQQKENENLTSVDECLETKDSWRSEEILRKDGNSIYGNDTENAEMLRQNDTESRDHVENLHLPTKTNCANRFCQDSPATSQTVAGDSNSDVPKQTKDLRTSHNGNIYRRRSSRKICTDKYLRRSNRLQQRKSNELIENGKTLSNTNTARKRRNAPTNTKRGESLIEICNLNCKAKCRKKYLKVSSCYEPRKLKIRNISGSFETEAKRYIDQIFGGQDNRRIQSYHRLRTNRRQQRQLSGLNTEAELNREVESEKPDTGCTSIVPQTMVAGTSEPQSSSIRRGFLRISKIIEQIKSIATKALMGKGKRRCANRSKHTIIKQNHTISKRSKQIVQKKYKTCLQLRKRQIGIKKSNILLKGKASNKWDRQTEDLINKCTNRNRQTVINHGSKHKFCKNHPKRRKQVNQRKIKTCLKSRGKRQIKIRSNTLIKTKAPKKWDRLLSQGNKRIFISPHVLTEKDLENLKNTKAIRAGSYGLYVFYRQKYYFRNVNSRILKYPMLLEKA